MSRPLERDKWAEAVFTYIPTTDENQIISAQALADATGLQYGQVIAAIAYLRETSPEFPLLSSASGYWFSIDEDEVAAFKARRVRSAITIIRRTHRGVLEPLLRRTASTRDQRALDRDVMRVIEDLEALIA